MPRPARPRTPPPPAPSPLARATSALVHAVRGLVVGAPPPAPPTPAPPPAKPARASRRPPAPKPGARFVLYANKMKLSGSLEQFLKWLVAVYQPDKGIAVTSLSLKIGPEPPKMAGEVEVSQFFRPNNP